MGSKLIIVVFAVVVIGGMGSILGSIVTGLGLGLVEGIVKSGMIANLLSNVFDSVPVAGSIVYPTKLLLYPEASAVTIFVIMASFCWCGRPGCSAGSGKACPRSK